MHTLLERQIRKITSRKGVVDYERFIALVNAAYEEHDRARRLQERAMQLMSTELSEANAAIRKERDEMVAAEQKRFELAVEGANDGIWDWDVIQNQLWFSDRSKAILGYSADQLQNCGIEDWYKLVHPEDLENARRFIEDNVRKYERNVITLRFNHASAGIRNIMCRVSVLQDSKGQVVRLIGAHTDITDIITMQEEIREARDRAEKASRSKSDFLANMSHEIRTPMNSIMGMTNLLLETKMGEQQQLWAEIIRNSSESLLDIINDILDISKIEAGKLELEEIPFDLFEMVEHATDTLLFKVQEKNIELLTFCHPSTPRYLIGDAGRIRQILINLMGNAIKFTKEGHVALSISSKQKDAESVELCFEVEDTGIGIPADKAEYIFEKFSQAEESTTRKFGGTGLGLAICRKLVRMMGGDIKVKSQLGEGSVFYFGITLPVNKIASSELQAPVADLSALKIMVVDDNPKSLLILKEYFSSWHLSLSFCDNAREALNIIEKAKASGDPFHILLVDYHLHGMNGKSVAAILRKSGHSDLQIVALRGGDPGDVDALRKEGFAAVVTKPFTPLRLMNKLAILWSNRMQEGKEGILTRYNYSMHMHEKQKIVQELNLEKLNVLIVEDIKANQIYLQTLLEKHQCRIDVASNGIEATQKTLQSTYDIIFMDCQMPEMDGFEATRAIRSQSLARQPHIVALTADAMQGDRERCLAAGMDDYLNKPVKAEKISGVLRQYATQKQIPAA